VLGVPTQGGEVPLDARGSDLVWANLCQGRTTARTTTKVREVNKKDDVLMISEGGSFDVEPADPLGHAGREPGRKGGNLFVDVHQEGVRGPASLFADCVAIDVVEMHGHGSACPQGVAANGLRGKALFVEFEGSDCSFYHCVDVGCLEGAWSVGDGRVVGADDVSGCALWVLHDGVDASCQGSDRAGFGVGSVVADDAAAGAVLLVGDTHGGFGRRVELVQGCSVWYDGVRTVVKSDVTGSKLLGAALVEFAMTSVFTDLEKVVECYGAHVAYGGDFF